MSQQNNTRQDIVIVGGGMVGISLALLLAQQFATALQSGQVTLTLIERFPLSSQTASKHVPSFDERSTALNVGSVTILESIGCWTALKPHAQVINTVHVSDRGHYAGAHLSAQDFARDALGYVVENRVLGQVLMAALEKSPVHCLAPTEVTHCAARKQGYELHLETVSPSMQKQSLVADLLIVADGSESPISQLLGIRTRVFDYGQTALIANVALEKSHQAIAYERFTEQGPMALLPLPPVAGEQRAALVWTLANAQVDELRNSSADALLARLQQTFGYRAGPILRIGQSHYYPLKRTEAVEQIRSHLVLIGNAAHFLHPVAGQGFNLALRDCVALAASLLESQSHEIQASLGELSTLQAYLNRQTPDQQLTISMTHHLVSLFSSSRAEKAIVRQLGLLGMNALAPVKERFAQQMMGAGEILW